MKFHAPPMRPDFRPVEGLCYALKAEAEDWWNKGKQHEYNHNDKAAETCFRLAKETASKADAEANKKK
jgi:hypothetical protein